MATPFSLPRQDRRSAWFFTCVTAIGCVALFDYLTGYELSLAVLYLGPIFVATWVGDWRHGVMMSILALAAWLISLEFMGFVYSHRFYHVWDALIRLTTWTIFVLLVFRLKVALARADERLLTVLEGLDAAVYVSELGTGKLLYQNQECRSLFGEGKVLQNTCQIEMRFAPREAAAGSELNEVHDARAGLWYLIHTRTIRWIDAREVCLHIATDVTAHKQTEAVNRQQQEKLQLSARLISVGEMASTLAHELNQPLAAIANYNMGCVRRLRSGEFATADVLEAMEKSGAEAARAGQIIQRVREMVRRREPQRLDCSVNDIISGIANTIRAHADKYGVSVELRLAPGLPQIAGDKVMLEQAILNLTRNAVEAMQETSAADRKVTIVSRRFDARTVEIQVLDRGCGIPPERIDNLFTPFFTTKHEGMGMGLNICRSIAEFHNGRLWASRNPDAGSTFHFCLPATQ